jgi:hypothetical protein
MYELYFVVGFYSISAATKIDKVNFKENDKKLKIK